MAKNTSATKDDELEESFSKAFLKLAKDTTPSQWAILVLASLAVVYAISVARGVLLPVMLAFFLSIVLRPMVVMISRIGIPRPLGTIFVLGGGIALIVLGFATLAEPLSEWLRRLPHLAWKLQYEFSSLKSSIEEAQQISEQVSEITEIEDNAERVVVEGPSLAEQALSQVQELFVSVAATVVLLFFLLSHKRGKAERIIAGLSDRDQRSQWLDAVKQVQSNISLYLRTITMINAGLGVTTAAIMAFLGLPDPVLWGLLAAIANFVPYIGPLAVLVLILGASLFTFDTWLGVVLPPAAFFLLTSIEGQILTPLILGRKLVIDPVVVFLAILFWGWLWGIPGALLAVPIVTMCKIVCDSIDSLKGFRPLFR